MNVTTVSTNIFFIHIANSVGFWGVGRTLKIRIIVGLYKYASNR